MALVSYSDSEGSASDEESSKPSKPILTTQPKALSTADTPPPFAVNRSNPRKIQVKLSQETPTSTGEDGEPPTKKPRIGGGGSGMFSGFNAMLPPPKAVTQPAQTATNGGDKKPTRKVFSLKTSAEPAFSREPYVSRDEWDAPNDTTVRREEGVKDNSALFKPPPPTTTTGGAMLFKPLSVARGSQKKKKTPVASMPAQATPADRASDGLSKAEAVPATVTQPAKVSLFSSGAPEVDAVEDEKEDASAPPDSIEVDPTDFDHSSSYPPANPPAPPNSDPDPNSLSSIASSLNLSASDRRLLLGRNHSSSTPNLQATSIINFNTDTEYSANESLRAAGEVVQHNPVRAIAPGKHSLKQLVSAASGQKEALEESFASGRRNRKEAGSKYGW